MKMRMKKEKEFVTDIKFIFNVIEGMEWEKVRMEACFRNKIGMHC